MWMVIETVAVYYGRGMVISRVELSYLARNMGAQGLSPPEFWSICLGELPSHDLFLCLLFVAGVWVERNF